MFLFLKSGWFRRSGHKSGVRYSRFSENWQPKKIAMNGCESDTTYPSMPPDCQGPMSTLKPLLARRPLHPLTCVYVHAVMTTPWQIRDTPQLPSQIRSPNQVKPQVRGVIPSTGINSDLLAINSSTRAALVGGMSS